MTRATLLRPLLRRQLWLSLAIAIVVLYVGAGGVAKLLGVPYVHSSFPKLGLPRGSATSSASAKCWAALRCRCAR
jgi:hypothetical protein